jgi:hypothetical protein
LYPSSLAMPLREALMSSRPGIMAAHNRSSQRLQMCRFECLLQSSLAARTCAGELGDLTPRVLRLLYMLADLPGSVSPAQLADSPAQQAATPMLTQGRQARMCAVSRGTRAKPPWQVHWCHGSI